MPTTNKPIALMSLDACLRLAAWLSLTAYLCLSPLLAYADSDFTPGVSIVKSVTTIRVEADATYSQVLSHTWRIENEQGVSAYSEEAIAYSSRQQTIEILEASITQPDGKVLTLGPDHVHDKADPLSEGAASFSDIHYKVIVYPEVQVGSQLHYKVRIKRHIPEYPGHFIYYEFFPFNFCYAHEETLLEVSEQLPIRVENKGGELIRLEAKDGYARYRFLFRQDNAIPTQPRQVAYQDHAPFLMASSFQDQIELGRAYQQRAKPMAAVTPDIQTLADELTRGIDDRREQVRILYHWVASNIRYVFIGLGDGGFVPQSAQMVLKNRYGDCKGHVVLLEALLAAKGIESSPALINSGVAYKLPPLAISYPFNHVITYVPELDLYLDATAQLTPFGYLPVFTMDKPVVLTALDRIGHTPLGKPTDHSIRSEVSMRMLADGSIEGSSQSRTTGWLEQDHRQEQIDLMHRQHRLVKDRLESYSESGSGLIKTLPPQDFSQPFYESTEFELDPVSNVPGPAAISMPTGPLYYALRDFALEKPNPESDIPSYCFSRVIEESHSIKLPDNIIIRHLPSDLHFENAIAKYDARYLRAGQKVSVTRTLTLDYPDFVCEQAEKRLIVELMDAMRRDLRSQVIYD